VTGITSGACAASASSRYAQRRPSGALLIQILLIAIVIVKTFALVTLDAPQ
jgi:hypothetical protein